MSELGPKSSRSTSSGPRGRARTRPSATGARGDHAGAFVRNLFTDDTGRFFAGIWRSTRVRGTSRTQRTNSACSPRVGADLRRPRSLLDLWPGDCFVMPAGFRGLWEVLEPARKFYAIFEPRRPSDARDSCQFGADRYSLRCVVQDCAISPTSAVFISGTIRAIRTVARPARASPVSVSHLIQCFHWPA